MGRADFLTICLVYLSYVVSAFLAKPEWLIALLHLLPPQLMQFIPSVKPFVQVPPFSASYVVILAALVGTTIAPWQHFYLQAAVVEKRVGPRQYGATRNDVLIGSISCMLIVFFIIVCTAYTLYIHGIHDIDSRNRHAHIASFGEQRVDQAALGDDVHHLQACLLGGSRADRSPRLADVSHSERRRPLDLKRHRIKQVEL